MTTNVLTKPFTIAPIAYDVQRELITQLAEEYMPLVVDGVDDKEGLEAVHKARMEVKGLRAKIEKRRLAEKELSDLLAPIETHLENEEAVADHVSEIDVRIEAQEWREATHEIIGLLELCEAGIREVVKRLTAQAKQEVTK